MHEQDTSEPVAMPKDPFAYIGFWQFMTFMMLLLLVWFNELRDTSLFFFDAPHEAPNYIRACILTVGVLIAAIVTIGNTYLQERRVLNSLISVCSNCHRVRVNKKNWQKMEDYIRDTSILSFSHGFCPECKEELLKKVKDRSDTIIEDSNRTRIE